MRNYKTSKYKKTIGISIENYDYIGRIKKKKSLAGQLDEIINIYRENEEYGSRIN